MSQSAAILALYLCRLTCRPFSLTCCIFSSCTFIQSKVLSPSSVLSLGHEDVQGNYVPIDWGVHNHLSQSRSKVLPSVHAWLLPWLLSRQWFSWRLGSWIRLSALVWIIIWVVVFMTVLAASAWATTSRASCTAATAYTTTSAANAAAASSSSAAT